MAIIWLAMGRLDELKGAARVGTGVDPSVGPGLGLFAATLVGAGAIWLALVHLGRVGGLIATIAALLAIYYVPASPADGWVSVVYNAFFYLLVGSPALYLLYAGRDAFVSHRRFLDPYGK